MWLRSELRISFTCGAKSLLAKWKLSSKIKRPIITSIKYNEWWLHQLWQRVLSQISRRQCRSSRILFNIFLNFLTFRYLYSFRMDSWNVLLLWSSLDVLNLFAYCVIHCARWSRKTKYGFGNWKSATWCIKWIWWHGYQCWFVLFNCMEFIAIPYITVIRTFNNGSRK